MTVLTRFLAMLAVLATIATASASEVPMGDDGLHKPDWFSLTFRDIAEDIEAAKSQGKRLALMFEQRGCGYCKEVHEKVLTDPEVKDWIKANYMIVQYNIHGAEELTDTDGESLTEKQAARKWGLMFTPTILFMPEDVPGGDVTVAQAAVAMMPGAFGKGTFLDMFQWVAAKGYDGDEDFQSYHNRRWRERNGGPPEATQ
ncbi:thioredoxin family protein [Tepidamorphus sp. 3E244]|uniref:thioredoxin family protein n=1 Tax=Tepidamorphus sp. 3E244 TaxID=3385498 RepID=UPI0038FC2924